MLCCRAFGKLDHFLPIEIWFLERRMLRGMLILTTVSAYSLIWFLRTLSHMLALTIGSTYWLIWMNLVQIRLL